MPWKSKQARPSNSIGSILKNGQIKPIKFAVGDPREVTVPAGTFEVFPVEQSGGQPGNTIYVTVAKPRRIVRFDVTGTSLQLQLLSLD